MESRLFDGVQCQVLHNLTFSLDRWLLTESQSIHKNYGLELSPLDSEDIIARPLAEVSERLLRGGEVKQIYELKGAGYSAREIARELGLARNTVLRYLKSPEAMRPKPRLPRGSKLDPYTEHIDRRMGEPVVHQRKRDQAAGLGIRNDHGVVAGLLRRAGQEGGHGRLHPVPCQRLRVPGRRAAPVPLRSARGGPR